MEKSAHSRHSAAYKIWRKDCDLVSDWPLCIINMILRPSRAIKLDTLVLIDWILLNYANKYVKVTLAVTCIISYYSEKSRWLRFGTWLQTFTDICKLKLPILFLIPSSWLQGAIKVVSQNLHYQYASSKWQRSHGCPSESMRDCRTHTNSKIYECSRLF